MTSTDPGGPPDFDGGGTVGILDLLALLANWGPCAWALRSGWPAPRPSVLRRDPDNAEGTEHTAASHNQQW